MSQVLGATISAGRWHYMAEIMAVILQNMLDDQHTGIAIPPGIYSDAVLFYRLAFSAAGDYVSAGPEAIGTYALVADAMRATRPDTSRAEVAHLLADQKALLADLQGPPHYLDAEEFKALSALQAFFLWLKREGESEILSGVQL